MNEYSTQTGQEDGIQAPGGLGLPLTLRGWEVPSLGWAREQASESVSWAGGDVSSTCPVPGEPRALRSDLTVREWRGSGQMGAQWGWAGQHPRPQDPEGAPFKKVKPAWAPA